MDADFATFISVDIWLLQHTSGTRHQFWRISASIQNLVYKFIREAFSISAITNQTALNTYTSHESIKMPAIAVVVDEIGTLIEVGDRVVDRGGRREGPVSHRTS